MTLPISTKLSINPKGFAGADFLVELSTGAESFRIFDAIDAEIPNVREYLEAIEFGITEYYENQAVESDLQVPPPTADFTVKSLYVEPGHTEVRHFKLVGAFAARQWHKEINKPPKTTEDNSPL